MKKDDRRKIVCLVGSTRFGEAYAKANLEETLAGKIVLSVGCTTHSDSQLGITDEQKIALDILHKDKITMADEILVLNCFRCVRCGADERNQNHFEEIAAGCCYEGHKMKPYIGDSTRSEIEHALKLGKRIRFLNPQGPSQFVMLHGNDIPLEVEHAMKMLGLT